MPLPDTANYWMQNKGLRANARAAETALHGGLHGGDVSLLAWEARFTVLLHAGDAHRRIT
jgi:hypothetical protein